MKKLLLLTAILVFACSSDDSSDTNDNSNQTFLERFDGVVWQADPQSANTEVGEELTFYSDPSSFNRDYYNYCRTTIFGAPYPQTVNDEVIGEFISTILDEDENSLVFSTQLFYNDGSLAPITVTVTCTVNSDGNILIYSQLISGNGDDSQFDYTFNIAPDEFPCN